MRFSTHQPPFSCGIDVPARSMDVCIVHHEGDMLLHRHRQAAPEPFLTAVAPSRARWGGAVACLVTWYGLAALGAAEGISCVRGHALSMQARHGGKATTDTIDAQQMAALLRGGLLPQAAVSPADLRAPRARCRRRPPLRRQRAALLAHGQPTPRQ